MAALTWCVCSAGLRWWWLEKLLGKLLEKPEFFVGSSGLIMSDMTPPSDKQLDEPFFFLDFDDNFLFLVWMPSFFIVSGRFTCNEKLILLLCKVGVALGVVFLMRSQSCYVTERFCALSGPFFRPGAIFMTAPVELHPDRNAFCDF